ncbi:hypothetical protein F5Y13DRAFT_164339 [Hypoxylon sp. FL1857]|nr:hypothetical protein F5Y13DRAFT_164339 [Hypoxylon sp. FL1857]
MDTGEAPSSPEESPFRQALERFKNEHLMGTETEKFQFTDLNSLKYAIKQIQDEQASKNKMRNLNKLKAFLEGMEQYEKLIEVFLNATQYLAFVWGPMKFLLQITNNFVKAFDAILDMYQDIGEQIAVLEKYQTLFDWKDKSHMKAVLEMIYVDILDFHAKGLSYFRQKTWRTLFGATWNTFRTRFDEPIQNFKRHRRLLENHATLSLFEELKVIRDNQSEAIKLQRESARLQEQDRVRGWLANEDMMPDQEHYIAIRRDYPGTGRWILKKRSIRIWMDLETEAEPIIWLTGIPGAGKTILASVIIEEISKQDNAQVIFFYCKDRHENRDNFLSIARSLLHQLSHNDEHLTTYINAEMSKSGDTTLKRPELVKKLLRIALINKDGIFIVIDGLDECAKGQSKEAVSWLQSIFKPDISAQNDDNADYTPDAGKVRCLVVSQDDGECSKLLNKFVTLKIQPDDNSNDIETFCRHFEGKVREKHGSSGVDIPMDISTRVASLSEGMFLFSKLVMENLFAQNRPFRLQQEIEWLEQGSRKQGVIGRLQEVFGRIVQRIKDDMEPESFSDALQILAWIVVAKRDLGWHEIQGAMSVDVEARAVDFRHRCLVVGPKELCGSLVELKPGDIVSLVHSSARHFLIQQRTINPLFEHLKLARICICYLSLDHFDPVLGRESLESNIRKGSYAFSHYAIAHWLDHVQGSATETSQNSSSADSAALVHDLTVEIRQFLRKHFSSMGTERVPGSFRKIFNHFALFESEDLSNQLMQAAYKWSLQLTSKGNHRNGVTEEPEAARLMSLEKFILHLHVALAGLAKRFQSSSDMQGLHRFHGTKLFKCDLLYCRSFYVGFESEGERDSHMKSHTRPFICNFHGCQYATIGFTTLKYLEAHLYDTHGVRQTNHANGGDFPVLDDPSSIDIKWAIKKGNLATVERWTEQFGKYIPDEILGVTRCIEKVSLSFDGVLKQALSTDYEKITLYFLKKIENVEDCHIDILRNLLKYSAKFEALNWILSLLPKRKVDPRVTAGVFQTRQAIHNPDIALLLVKYFARCGCSVRQDVLRSILKQVTKIGHAACVQFLVDECKIDANFAFAGGRTLLVEAAERGHESIFRFLMAEGRCTQDTVNRRTNGGQTAAELAASNGHEAIIRMLSTEEAMAGECPRLRGILQLRQAAIEGDAERISGLLEQGDIPIDLPDMNCYSPFLHAVENGRVVVADLFLSRGKEQINLNRRCNYHHPLVDSTRYNIAKYGAPALIIACANGHKEIVRLLLKEPSIDKNVEIDMDGNMHSHATDVARRLGFVEICRLLDEAAAVDATHDDSKRESSEQLEPFTSDVDSRSLDESGNSVDGEY